MTRTSTRLLEDLRDPANTGAWSVFDARYRPVLIALARRLGFSHADAVDLAQQSLAEFASGYVGGLYNRGEGRLSSWLIGIARHVASGMFRQRAKSPVHFGVGSAIDERGAQLPEHEILTQIWAAEREQLLLAEAMSTLRESSRLDEHTMHAFDLFVLRGVPAAEVAMQCGIGVDTVYVIKNRLIKRLREIVRELTDAFDEGR